MPSKGKLLIGITGGIGSGKSLASGFFESSGYTIIYADEVAKRVYRVNSSLKQRLVKAFGKHILDSSGNISGIEARKIILSDKKNVKKVNRIVHPFVVKEINEIIKKANDNIVLIEAAIMFESGYYRKMNYTILIYAPKELRIKRVSRRDKIPKSEVRRLINLQIDEREKIKLADFIIRNDGSKQKLLNALKTFNNFIKMLS